MLRLFIDPGCAGHLRGSSGKSHKMDLSTIPGAHPDFSPLAAGLVRTLILLAFGHLSGGKVRPGLPNYGKLSMLNESL